MPTFDGVNIFGAQVSQIGPTAKTRAMREQLPGVKGFRVYNLSGEGPDIRVFVVRGRLVDDSAAALQGRVVSAQAMLNRIATFVDNTGTVWRNCMLAAYDPASPYKVCVIETFAKYTVEITATLEQASP